MAVLSDSDRAEESAKFQRNPANLHGDLSKPDLRAAVNAVDSWVDSNSAAFNSAIPQPARTLLTSKQKAALLMAVVTRRFEVA